MFRLRGGDSANQLCFEYPSPEGEGRECVAQVVPTICLKRGDTNLRAELRSLLNIEIVVNNSCRFLVTFLFLCV